MCDHNGAAHLLYLFRKKNLILQTEEEFQTKKMKVT